MKKCPKNFWHKLFTTWKGESKNRTRANCFGSKWRIEYWYNEYHCNLCNVRYKVDVEHENSK